MRLDRFITLNLIQPLRSLMPKASGSAPATLPVLMYHSISDDPEPGVGPYYRVCTSPHRFREQMQLLREQGFCGVTLAEGLAWLAATSEAESERPTSDLRSPISAPCPPTSDLRSPISDLRPPSPVLRPVALTFDDGFRDFHTAAWPVLREFGFTATMFLPTAFVGKTQEDRGQRTEDGSRKAEAGDQTAESGNPSSDLRPPTSAFGPRTSDLRPPTSVLRFPGPAASDLRSPISDLGLSFNGRECLTWSEVRELHQAGMEFGSHTVNHPKLVDLSWAEIERELRDSKTELERQLGEPVTTFAYPYAFPHDRGDFVDRFKDLLKSSGYETNVTTQIGRHRLGDDALQIKRLPMNCLDDGALLEAKLAGDYDWLARPQDLVKKLKRRISKRRAERGNKPQRHRDTETEKPFPSVKSA